MMFKTVYDTNNTKIHIAELYIVKNYNI